MTAGPLLPLNEGHMALFAEMVSPAGLTERELQVAYIELVCRVKRKGVARMLAISIKTTDVHMSHVWQKLAPGPRARHETARRERHDFAAWFWFEAGQRGLEPPRDQVDTLPLVISGAASRAEGED